jgi:ribosomal protein S18 acetylase RimI-like enzyme
MRAVDEPATVKEHVTSIHPATPEEFAAYRDYVMSDDSPDRTTRQDFDRLLPEGLQTRNQHLLSIRTDEGTQAGLLWLTVIDRKSEMEAFLLDFVIFPIFRRRGHARESMAQLEDYVSNLGLDRISLSVSEYNNAARALYRSLDYEPVFTRMTKKCKGGTNHSRR